MAITMQRFSTKTWTLLLAFLLLCHVSSSYRFVIDRKECLQEFVNAGQSVTGSFVVFDFDNEWRDEFATVELMVQDPKKVVVYHVDETADDRYEFTARQTGIYNFCFTNKSPVPETVDVEIHVSEEVRVPDNKDPAHAEHLNQVFNHLATILEDARRIQVDQEYFKSRDLRRKKTSESTNRRVVKYAVLEFFVLVGASAAQIFILRRLFETRSRLLR